MEPHMEDAGLRRRLMTLEFWRDLLLLLTLAVTGLVYGAGFLVPLTFAALVVVLLNAVADRVSAIPLAGQFVPLWLANVIGILLVLFGFAVIALILSSQADGVAETIPRYAERLEAILASLVSLVGEENALEVRQVLQEVDMSGWALGALGSAGGFLSGFLLVMLYIPFMMVETGPMGRKLRIAAPNRRAAAEISKITRSISRGLQRYIGVKTFVSLLTGLFSYAVMKPMGLDFAETWAVLAFALNFIPSIGSVLGVVLPAIVALVQFDTITPFLVIVLGCGTVQFSIGNILEPAIFGRSLNLSPFLVILALTFWTAVWGVAGALLSVPIMVGFLIVFAHIPCMQWLAILMSGDGDLSGIMEIDEEERAVRA